MKTQNNQIETNNLNTNNANRTGIIQENQNKQVITSNLKTNNNNPERTYNNINYMTVKKTNNNGADYKKLNIEMRTQNNYIPNSIQQIQKSKSLINNFPNSVIKNENQKLIDRLYEEIFKSNLDQTLLALNKYTPNVQNNNKMDELIKKINDENMRKEDKDKLYFQLKAGTSTFSNNKLDFN